MEEKECLVMLKITQIMARNMLRDLCASLIGFLKNIIFSDSFLSSHKIVSKNFIRNRILPFHTILFFLMNLIKGSYQDELDYFFKAIDSTESFIRKVTKSALCKARKKLKYEAFTALNTEAVNFFQEHFSPVLWNGFSLKAIDGSTLKVPRTQEVEDHFGVWDKDGDAPCPLARISQLFDVLNKITIDAIISPKAIGERDLCQRHFINLKPNDLFLLDRGYPAYWLFNLILTRGANFCARVSCTKWLPIKKFFHSGRAEQIINLKAPTSSIKKCRELGLNTQTLKLRLVRIELENGETEILITSLIDTEIYPLAIFSDLYHHRWPIEEDYKAMKCRIEIENFTGKSVLSVYQDFHARVFTKNLTAMLAHPTRQAIERNSEHKAHSYQINFTQALSKMKDTVVLLFTRSRDIVNKLVASLHEVFIKTVEPVRLNRKFPRKHKVQRKGFYPCYKPIR